MTEALYISRVRVRPIARLHRRAMHESGAEWDFGVHGPIREHYHLEPDRELPLPVDAIVAATGG